MELVFTVNTYDYLIDLLNLLGDLSYEWYNGSSLYSEHYAKEAWDLYGDKGLLIILVNGIVSYGETQRSFFCDKYKFYNFDTVEELKCAISAKQITIPFQDKRLEIHISLEAYDEV